MNQAESGVNLLQAHLELVRRNLSPVDRVLHQYGHFSLAEYLANFFPEAKPAFQSRDDALQIVARYAAPLLGERVAKRAAEDLAAYPIVLTANHHGVDCYAQTLQSRILFSLRTAIGISDIRTVPVLACGNVPLNNLTYPRGLLFYCVSSGELDAIPLKLPLFPDRLKRTMVCTAPACDNTMIAGAQVRLDRMLRRKSVSSEIASAARTILREDYGFPTLRGFPDYSRQTVILNSLIWKRLFAEGARAPEMVSLELENLVGALLARDLTNPDSLAWGVLFDSKLRENVLAELNGVKGCWNRDRLDQRTAGIPLDGTKSEAGKRCGTVFFWGVDGAGRRIPLSLETGPPGRSVLRGLDDEGVAHEIPWSPGGILKAVQDRRLVPSLFTCFLVLVFARGFCCVGGYFQGEYLPAMQQGLAAALQETSGYHGVAEAMKEVPTTLYLDGMTAVMSRTEEGALVPAGPLEIIAGGGLTGAEIARILSLTLSEAHLAGLSETIPDATPAEARVAGWKRQLFAACSELLEGKIVIKPA